MYAVNVLDQRAVHAAVEIAANNLRLSAIPWKRPTPSDIVVLMSPRTYEATGLASSGVVDFSGYAIVLDPDIPPETLRVRDKRNMRDEIVRLTL